MPDKIFNHLRPYLSEEADHSPVISGEGVKRAAALLGLEAAPAMIRLLKRGVWPARFSRNRGLFTADEQAKLLETKAALVGCGGLGGQAAALLARVGLGALVLCDRDVFEETNLNRQLFSREDNLGRNKAEAVAREIFLMASHVQVTVWPEEAKAENLAAIIGDSHIVLDCLDSIAARLELEKAAHRAGLSFVHGAIAGEEGFAMITRPGEKGLSALYGEKPGAETANAEKILGVPTVTPAVLASLEVHLAVRELLGKETRPLILHHLDLSVPSLETLYL